MYKKIAPSNPNLLDLKHCKGFGTTRSERNHGSLVQHGKREDHENEKEIEKGQQDMQEKIFQVTKMVTSLKKEKGITEDPSLQDWSAS